MVVIYDRRVHPLRSAAYIGAFLAAVKPESGLAESARNQRANADARQCRCAPPLRARRVRR